MAKTPESETRARGAMGRRGPTRKFEAKRALIVSSAIEQINRRGVRGMTLGSVAAQLGLVPTAVIYYFKSKEDLASEVFLRGIGRFDDMIRTAGDVAQPDRVARFLNAYFDDRAQMALGEREGLAVFNDVRALNAGAVNDAYVEMFRGARSLLPDAAGLPRLHRNARAHLLLSEMFWIVAWLDHQVTPADYGRTADRMSSILVDGLMAPGVAWPKPAPIELLPADLPDGALSAEQFLRAATQVINEEGYHGASVDRISAKLNVSKGAFYHHNATKDELVVACFHRTFEIIWRAIRAAEASSRSGLEVLVTVASALIERQMSGDSPVLRTSALTTVPEAIHAELIHELDRISYRFASILCDGVNDGSVVCADVNIAAQMITGAINASAELHHWALGLTPQAGVDHYVKPLFQGLASPIAR
ncbi:MAG: TetR/AcrR family transcriptional regulator [Alphaproteobacteria bacterium]|nr:TetR/AcrR family transcriptional regulator [Alphaproteobacteria bacterium]MBU1516410.1 TetR/AcrR family transcriptional regulator [Alphaproteobacteria bacterium]MBU2093353.1 TetR/AcrR family transcriptional regulator [Alphaproteobacteria bacterium]MBU2153840.1 TetR/AcrR family transcriptional regulator [Alphaproteobacteria bacterium]MBU2307712.1 TetR/AcrR family transcriptional regulator [Alphaproteobacteria bacterium]